MMPVFVSKIFLVQPTKLIIKERDEKSTQLFVIQQVIKQKILDKNKSNIELSPLQIPYISLSLLNFSYFYCPH